MILRPYFNLNIAAGASLGMVARGDFFKVLAISGPASIEIHVDDQGIQVPLSLKERYRAPGVFDSFRIHNPSGTPAVVTLLVGQGDHDGPDVVGVVTVSGTVTVAGQVKAEAPASIFNEPDTALAGAAVQLVGASASRGFAVISALAANSAPIRVGAAGVTAASGVQLLPGEKLRIETQAAIYGIAEAGTQYASGVRTAL